MPLPGGINTITVTGTHLDAQGVAKTGSVEFTLGTALTDSSDHVVLASGTYAASLVAGVYSIVLPCTDNSSLSPSGFTYTITEQFNGGRPAYSVSLPHSLGSTVDDSTLIPVSSSPGVSTVYGVLAQSNTWTGVLNDFTGSRITVSTPTSASHAANKSYVDTAVAGGGGGGGIPLSILIAKGDLVAATSASSAARVAVGTDGQVLTASSAASTGVAWSTPSGPVLINSTVLSSAAASITIAVPAGYSALEGYFFGRCTQAIQGQDWIMTINGDTTGGHYQWNVVQGANGVFSASNASDSSGRMSSIPGASATANYFATGRFSVVQPGSGQFKTVIGHGVGPSDHCYTSMFGIQWFSTAAITSITLQPGGGSNLVAGSGFALYGVV